MTDTVVMIAEIELLRRRVDELHAENERLTDIHHRITNWCKAYPLECFPEPDFKRADEVLKAHGISLDAISGSNMRHVVTGIQKIIDGTDEAPK